MPVLAGIRFLPIFNLIGRRSRENLTVFNQDDANGKMLIPRELEGFDVAAAVERMLDRPELWWQAVGLFVMHFSDWLSRWQGALGEDAAERKQVHALRSAAENIGAVRLAAAAASLEAALLGRLAGREVAISDDCRAELTAAYLATMAVLAKGGAGPVGKA
ncbi:hypothetical protein ACLIIZ_12560 [Azonexus caeni]|jgi:HPt (histidine-containing phosphotransfer) domain-containing protein|uniref:hypothetical protein n=1 Tax=Azonexus caeni TaxID=266126 RepID=UPI003A868A5F